MNEDNIVNIVTAQDNLSKMKNKYFHKTMENALKVYEKVLEVGLTYEKLEALAEGRAWIAEWSEMDKDVMSKKHERIIVCGGGDINAVKDVLSQRTHYMTFNGSTKIPEPKGE